MKVKVEYLSGKSSPSEWSGVYGYKPDDTDEIEFFAVMRIGAQTDELSLDMMSKMLFDEIQNSFFDETNLEKDLVLRLETSAWKMKSKMDLILSREQEVAQKGLDIEMAVAVIYQDYLYVGVIGESKIFIKRGEEVVELSKALVDGDMSGFLKSGSLELEENDRLLLITSKSDNANLQNAIENLDINILDSLSQTGVAGILIADQNDSWAALAPSSSIEEDFVKETPEEDYIPYEEDYIEELPSVDEPSIETPEQEITETPQLELEEEEYIEEEEGPSFKERLAPVVVGVKNNILNLGSKIKKLRSQNDEESEEDDGSRRFSDMVEEEDEVDSEPEMKDKLLAKASLLGSSAKEQWQKTLRPGIQRNQKTYMKVLKTVGGKIFSAIKGVYLYLKSELVGTGDRRDYLKSKSRSRNRKIAIAVVVVLVIFLFFGLRSAEENRREQEIIETARKRTDDLKDRYATLSSQVQQAKSESDDRKNILLTEFDKLGNDVDSQKKSGLFTEELDQIVSGILVNKDDLLFVESFTQSKLVTDVGKTYPDANLTDIAYSNGFVFISDAARNVIYKVNSSTLDNKAEAYINDLEAPYLLVKDAAGDIIFYDNDTTSALGKFGYNEPNLTRFGQLTPANIGKPTESVIYEGNNSLYELKSINRQIFKRDKAGDTYANGGAAVSTDSNSNWRTDSDFSNGIDIAAPYEIYVLIKGQGVKRYFARNENTISYSTFNNFLRKDFDSLAQATAMDVTGRYMAIGDPVNKRVLLFQIEDNETKNITFIKQFVYRGSENVFNDIKELAINEQERAVYVLDASRVIKLQF